MYRNPTEEINLNKIKTIRTDDGSDLNTIVNKKIIFRKLK